MPTLAIQLHSVSGSESMGDHDSGHDEWWSVGRGYAVPVGAGPAGRQAAYRTLVHAGAGRAGGVAVPGRPAGLGATQDRMDACRGGWRCWPRRQQAVLVR
jgi:hypothetical protein